MIGVMIPNVFAEISYPTIDYRLKELPTYCIVDPENFSTSERRTYATLAERAVAKWDRALHYSGAEHIEYWKMDSKIIPFGNEQNDCTIVIYFVENASFTSGDEFVNAAGWFSAGYTPPKIVIGVENFSERTITNTLLHEIGHSFGLGHYVSDDPELNDHWNSGKIPSPSIMVEILNSNPLLQYIEDVDVQKVLSIYGSNGFKGFSTNIPIPEPPIKPKIPKFPFYNIHIMHNEIILESYGTTYSKITGMIKESEFLKGHPVFITIIKSDGTLDVHKISTAKSGYFELPLLFDKNSPTGYYSVIASYLGHIDTSMEFSFLVNFKEIISVPNEEKEISSDVNFGYDNTKKIGSVDWSKWELLLTKGGIVSISDIDMNLDSNKVDKFKVDVWSHTDSGGIELTVTETDKSSGIFEGTVFFTKSKNSHENTLKVSIGDTVTVEYLDNTLPGPYTAEDILGITDIALITEGLSLTANAVEGSTIIDISGSTTDTNNEIVFVVTSPDGNLVSVDPINPDRNGDFAIWYGVKDPLWSQDGVYTVTAQQGNDLMFTDSIEVEIENGVIVPEFGTITAMILAVAIILIVAISAKSRLSIVPRY
jgi:predicted secreted protein with PEFG-CTERM motif